MTLCWYCGEYADSIDHALPKSVAGEETRKVWACRDCNSRAEGCIFATMGEKASYIREHLRRKYASVLRAKDWTEDELSELGPSLRESVVQGGELRDRLKRRIGILGTRSANKASTHGGKPVYAKGSDKP